MEQAHVKWESGMAFTASIEGYEIRMDASPEFGGTNGGTRPKPLLLVALAGCTGMDIASLAQKMRVEIKTFEMDVQAQQSEEHPIVFTSITLIYRFTAKEEDRDKIVKMVTLSQERYCGVAAMLSRATELNYRIELNGKKID